MQQHIWLCRYLHGQLCLPLLTSLMLVICSFAPRDQTTLHFLTGPGKLSSFSTVMSNLYLVPFLPPDLWPMPREMRPSILAQLLLPLRPGLCQARRLSTKSTGDRIAINGRFNSSCVRLGFLCLLWLLCCHAVDAQKS
jgi:hypothetical protein